MDDGIPFEQAEEFCLRAARFTGLALRLPSEAEWEYACRAGTTTRFHFGETEYREFVRAARFTPVGSRNEPNRFGLFDMHCASSEWCADWSHPDYVGAPLSERPWLGGGGNSSYRMLRLGTGGAGVRSSFPLGGSFTGLAFRVALSLNHGSFDPSLHGVVHAASGRQATSISPGQLISLYGEFLAPGEDRASDLAVYVNESIAPVLYASWNQINAVVPFAVPAQESASIVVRGVSQSSLPVFAGTVAAAPALFTSDGTGAGPAAALNQDGSLNTMANPAASGSVVALYGTGFGKFERAVPDGEVAPDANPITLECSASIGGLPAGIEYAGQAPTLVAGVVQVNLRIDPGVATGRQPVVLSAGGIASPPGVTIFVAR